VAVSVTLPKMGESVVEGTIIRWLKQEGDTVTEDEPLVEISTDKIDAEMPSPASGVLKKIVAQPDQTVDVGAEIAIIEENGSGAAAPAREAAGAPEAAAPPVVDDARVADLQEQQPEEPALRQPPPPLRTPEVPADDDGAGIVASPLVRKLAREHGVDLAKVRGTGAGGRITKDDVLAAARGSSDGARAPQGVAPATSQGSAPQGSAQQAPQRAPAAPAASTPSRAAATASATSSFALPQGEYEDVPFSRVRKAIAEHMLRSLQTAAQLTNIVEADMTRVVDLRARALDRFKQAEGFSLTYLPFVAQAVVQALRAFPEFNAHVLEDGSTARLFRSVNIGIAVGRDEGLIVPVVHGADGMNLIGLARAVRDISTRARTKGGLKPDDVTGGTFTISNYGSVGGLMDTPIISQPQVAILGTGSIVKRPMVVEIDSGDAVAVRHMMYLSLTYDHRWVDGHRAAQFNNRIKLILEEADFAHELGLVED
jgi:2-oxoglutarate dehydrogenase E2 component (dihydrolipoamide succinyltransferase)